MSSGKLGFLEEDDVKPTMAYQAGTMDRVILPGGVPLELVYCPAGTFWMGSPKNEANRDADEVLHRVTLTNGFWMGKYPVTQRQWTIVMGSNPSYFKGGKILGLFGGVTLPDNPVENVSWNDCQTFCQKLNEKLRDEVGDRKFRLPTEAEWEYACRAGTGGPYAGELDGIAWHGCNSEGKTHPVGQKTPNTWNLYDMHGNVCEWCSDGYGSYGGDATDPEGLASGDERIIRGGSWCSSAQNCRSACRYYYVPSVRFYNLGFRLARTLP